MSVVIRARRGAPWRIRASTRGSMADVASSSTSSCGRRASARASASRCRWPPESVTPRSPRIVCGAVGQRRRRTASAWATARAAASSRSRIVVGARRGRSPRRVSANTNDSWNTSASRSRRRVAPEPVGRRDRAIRIAPSVGAIEPDEQLAQRALAASGRADERDDLARGDRQVDVGEHRPRRSGTSTRRRGPRPRPGSPAARRGRAASGATSAARTRSRRSVATTARGISSRRKPDDPHREREQREQRHRLDDVAGRDHALGDPPAADREDRDDPEVRERVERRLEERAEPPDLDALLAERVGGDRQAARPRASSRPSDFTISAPSKLSCAIARHLAHVLLDGGGGPLDAPGVVAVQQRHQREQDEADEGEDRVDDEQRDHREDDEDARARSRTAAGSRPRSPRARRSRRGRAARRWWSRGGSRAAPRGSGRRSSSAATPDRATWSCRRSSGG